MQDNPASQDNAELGANLPPTILVIFGVTGDLARRYLMPSLYHLFKQNLLPENFEIIGVSRRNINLDDLFNKVEMCVSEDDNICDPVVMARMHSHTRVQQLDMDDADSFKKLKKALDDIEQERGVCLNRLYYLSIPPGAYENVLTHMGEADLNGSCSHGKAQTRLLAEKPFGQDLASAEQLVKTTAKVFTEEQIFRIDHYLAKETAQNILAFRFENPLFEAVWNNQFISAIDITASEKIGIEGRVDFYEQQGALRDFVQNHLLQLLAVATMDRPKQTNYTADDIHAAKLALLQAVLPVDDTASQASRGQYRQYRQEVNNPASSIETYAAIKLQINNDRWQGVPVTIRTGKAMADRYTTITVTFSQPNRRQSSHQNNLLQFRIQPNEGIQLDLLAKKPGYDQEIQAVAMDFSYRQSFAGYGSQETPTAYERVLVDAIRGDRSLFAGSQEVLAAWKIVDPVTQAWSQNDKGLEIYDSGTDIDDLNFPTASSAA